MAQPVKKANTAKKTAKAATAQKAAPSNLTQMKAPEKKASPEEVARLAHRFWAERGRQHGKHEEDWFRAEQELRGKAS